MPTLRIASKRADAHRLIQVHPLAVLENSHLSERGSQIVVVENPHLRQVANGGLEVRQRAGKSRNQLFGEVLRLTITNIVRRISASPIRVHNDYPYLEREDILAAIEYAALQTDYVVLLSQR